MSQENVENLQAFLDTIQDIRAFVDAAKRGDADLSLLDPDVVYEDANLPDHIGEAYRGHEGILRAAERWVDASSETIELERIVGSDDRAAELLAEDLSAPRTVAKALHSRSISKWLTNQGGPQSRSACR